jgi:hypothetical protein
VKTRHKAQLCGQQLPAKKGKVRAKLTQTMQIQDWDSLTPEQQQETLNWGIDVDVSSDSEEGMATATFTQVASGSGVTGGGLGSGAPGGGGGPPGGGGGGGSGGSGPPGGGGHGPPAVPPTLDELNRLMANLGNIVGILAQQAVDLTQDRAGGRCYVFTGLSYLIALPDSLSLGLSFFHLISHPIHCARLVSPCDLLIRSCDLLSCSTTFYHYYSYY